VVQLRPAKLDRGENVGEKLIFEAIKRVAHEKEDWIVLHSLDQVEAVKGLQAETDFVVLIPTKGIIVIEAKGATNISIEDGKWTLDGVPPKKKHLNPFDQIDNGIRGIRGFLKKRGYDVDSIPFARMAWFPRIDEKNIGSYALGSSAKYSELGFAKQLSEPLKSLRKVIDSHIGAHKDSTSIHYNPEIFTAEMASHIADALRPTVKMAESLESKAAERKLARTRATEEQVLLLELVEKNPSIYFEGAAGTGKTEILRQAALNLKRQGRQVLYVCYNVMLAEKLQEELGQVLGVTVLDVNSLLLKVAGLKKNPANADSLWYEDTLPDQALIALDFNKGRLSFDAICIDEFQDIASRPKFFEVLQRLQRNTYMPFKLLLAGDDQQQIAGNGLPIDSFRFAQDNVPNLVHVGLNTNCRQSPLLARQIVKTLNMEDPNKRHRLADDEPGALEVYRTTKDSQAKDLAKVLKKLLETYRPQDIRVLSIYGGTGSVMAKLLAEGELHSKELRELRQLLKNQKTKTGKISWRSIGKYKGLEDDVVVLTDISEDASRWLEKQEKTLKTQVYVGLTRARTHAVMLVQDDLYNKYAKRIEN
jgi:hypothetical protein